MNPRLLLCVLLLLWPLAAPRLAVACQCSPEGADAALRRAPLIIEGTVVRQRPSTSADSQRVVDLNAVRTLRGEPLGPTLSIKNGLECAPQVVEPGKRYVIYLASKDSVMTACSRVVESDALAPEEVRAFGGRAPTPSAEPPPAAAGSEPTAVPSAIDVHARMPAGIEQPTAGGCAGCALADGDPASGLAGLIALFAVGLLARPRRRLAARSLHRRGAGAQVAHGHHDGVEP